MPAVVFTIPTAWFPLETDGRCILWVTSRELNIAPRSEAALIIKSIITELLHTLIASGRNSIQQRKFCRSYLYILINTYIIFEIPILSY